MMLSVNGLGGGDGAVVLTCFRIPLTVRFLIRCYVLNTTHDFTEWLCLKGSTRSSSGLLEGLIEWSLSTIYDNILLSLWP